MQKGNSLSFLLLGFTILLTILAGSFYLNKTSAKPSIQQTVVTPTSQPQQWMRLLIGITNTPFDNS